MVQYLALILQKSSHGTTLLSQDCDPSQLLTIISLTILQRTYNDIFEHHNPHDVNTEAEQNWEEQVDKLIDDYFENFTNISYLFRQAISHDKMMGLKDTNKEELKEFACQVRNPVFCNFIIGTQSSFSSRSCSRSW